MPNRTPPHVRASPEDDRRVGPARLRELALLVRQRATNGVGDAQRTYVERRQCGVVADHGGWMMLSISLRHDGARRAV